MGAFCTTELVTGKPMRDKSQSFNNEALRGILPYSDVWDSTELNSTEISFLPRTKYLILHQLGAIEEIPLRQSTHDDLVLKPLENNHFLTFKNGIHIMKLFALLTTRFEFRLVIETNNEEEEQLELLNLLKKACRKKSLAFPIIQALAIHSGKTFRNVQCDDPVLVRDRRHGIWIAGYGRGKEDKSCARKAVSKLLSISESSRSNHYVFDDSSVVIDQAKLEGWKTCVIREDFPIDRALNKILENAVAGSLLETNEEAKDPSEEMGLQDSELSMGRRKSSRKGPGRKITLDQAINELKSQILPELSSKEMISNKQIGFETAGTDLFEYKEEIESKVKSSFIEARFKNVLTGKEWIGKTDLSDPVQWEVFAFRAKVAREIYNFYGACVQNIESITYTKPQGKACVYLLSESHPELISYKAFCDGNFDIFQLNKGRELVSADGRKLPERGLGTILAVAMLLGDTNAIGTNCENTGLFILRDPDDQEYARTVKLHPGIFSENSSVWKQKAIPVGIEKDIEILSLTLANLPSETQKEFLTTLKRIIETSEATFRGFFEPNFCKGDKLNFVLARDEELKKLLERRNQLRLTFKDELTFAAEESKLNESKEEILTISNKQCNYKDFRWYVQPDVIIDGSSRIPLLEALEPLFDFNMNSVTAMLLKGEPGIGKTAALELLENYLSEKFAEQSIIPVYLDLKGVSVYSLKHSLQQIIVQRLEEGKNKIILLIDSFDQMVDDYFINLNDCWNLDNYWPNLRIVISCRTRSLKIGDQMKIRLFNQGFQEFEMQPFNRDQIAEFIKKQAELSNYKAFDKFEKLTESIPGINELITNSLNLKLVCESLPLLEKKLLDNTSQTRHVNRFWIYESFIDCWIEKQKSYLGGVSEKFKDFCMDIAYKIHHKGETYAISYDWRWETYFTSKRSGLSEARDGCPLKYLSDGRFCFHQKSFLDYFTAKLIIERVLNDRIRPDENLRIILRDPMVRDFIIKAVDFHPSVKIDCLVKIKNTQSTSHEAHSAGAVMTLLNLVRFNFSSMELGNIVIPGAILDHGLFDSTNFTGADLTGASFHGAWLRNANFKNAAIKNVSFESENTFDVPAEITSTSFSFNGKYLLTVAKEYIYLFEWDSIESLLRHRKTISIKYYQIASCAISCDGKLVAAGCSSGEIFLWHITEENFSPLLLKHNSAAISLEFSSDCQRLVSRSLDETIRIWSTLSREIIQVIPEYDFGITTCTLSNDGKHLIGGSKDGAIYSWDAFTGSSLGSFNLSTSTITSCRYNFNGRNLVFGAEDGRVYLCRADSIKIIQVFEGHTKRITSCAFTPDDSFVVTSSDDNTIRIWSAICGECLKTLQNQTAGFISCIFSPDGNYIISVGQDKTLCYWQTPSGPQNTNPTEIVDCAFHIDGKLLVTTGADSVIRVWDVSNDHPIKCIQGHSDKITSCTLSPDGKQIASGSYDKTVRVWDLETGQPRFIFDGHQSFVTSCAFSPDGNLLVSGSSDKKIHIWDCVSGEQIRVLQGHTLHISRCVFSSDGKKVASASWDSTVRVWDSSKGVCLRVLQGSAAHFTCCAFSPDNKQIVAGSVDGLVIVWNHVTGSKIHSSQEHTSPVSVCGFASNGKQIFSGYEDGTVKVWSIGTQFQNYITLRPKASKIVGASFIPMNLGYSLSLAHADGDVEFWQISRSGSSRLIWAHHNSINLLDTAFE